MDKEIYKDLDGIYKSEAILLVVDSSTGDIVAVSKPCCDLFKYDSSELIGCKVEKLIPQTFREQHTKDRENYCKAPKRRPMGLKGGIKALTKEGEELNVAGTLLPSYTQGQQLIVVLITEHDENF